MNPANYDYSDLDSFVEEIKGNVSRVPKRGVSVYLIKDKIPRSKIKIVDWKGQDYVLIPCVLVSFNDENVGEKMNLQLFKSGIFCDFWLTWSKCHKIIPFKFQIVYDGRTHKISEIKVKK